jgi:hypothetical protein
MRYLIVLLVILSLALTGCVSPAVTQGNQPPAGNAFPKTTNWTPPPPPPSPVQTAHSTAFEMLVAEDTSAPATGPYKLLVVRVDGLVYYEEGRRSHFMPTSVLGMKQGQISEQEVNALIKTIEEFPFQTVGIYNDIEYDARSSKLGNTNITASLAFPVYRSGDFRGKLIRANYDLFTQDFTILSDVQGTVKRLWGQLRYIVENDTSTTDTHPDLYPSFLP